MICYAIVSYVYIPKIRNFTYQIPIIKSLGHWACTSYEDCALQMYLYIPDDDTFIVGV